MNWSKSLQAIHSHITKVDDVYFPTVAKNNGTAGQGDTCEARVFGIARNNDKGPDFHGVEIKTTSGKSLTMRPFTMAGGYENHIRENWGGISNKGVLRFNRSFKVGVRKSIPKRHGGSTTAELINDNQSLKLLFDGDVVGRWPIDSVVSAVQTKMPNLCIIEADKKTYGVDCYRYHSYTFYAALNTARFVDLINDGSISIEFRIRQKDYGTCFRLSKKVLPSMYEKVISFDEYSGMIS